MENQEEISNFVNVQDIVLSYYDREEFTGYENCIYEIENWVNNPVQNEKYNKPYVLVGQQGQGRKAILTQWAKFHQKNSKKKFQDIILFNFASNKQCQNQFFAIYRFLIQLRQILNVQQYVQLVEEKIRKFFAYWLEVCQRIIEKQVINDQNIILVFESIDLIKNNYNDSETQYGLWLPDFFPTRCRVIISCEPNSMAHQNFEKKNCKLLQLSLEDKTSINNFIIESRLNKFQSIDNQLQTKFMEIIQKKSQQNQVSIQYVKLYVNFFLPNLVDFNDKIKKTFQKIYSQMDLRYLETVNDIESLFILMINQFEGAFMDKNKFRELVNFMGISQKGFTQVEILKMSNVSLLEWKIFQNIFCYPIVSYKDLYKFKGLFQAIIIEQLSQSQNDAVISFHIKAADALQFTNMSVRKLEEQCYHLSCSKQWFKLKETVSTIENFLVLFNPDNKYELCRIWQKLEIHNFDPVTEYNKSVEGFQIQFLPSEKDLFRIILQISRFLKEFSDFETQVTPKFRHPPLNRAQDLQLIGLLDELQIMNMFSSEEEKQKCLSDIESLQIEVPENGNIFRNELIRKIIENMDDIKKIKYKDIIQKFSVSEEENVEFSSKIKMPQFDNPDYYYYKRWIWIMFPWACICNSKSTNFSKQIKKSFASTTQYMTIEQEKEYTEKALKIALDSKAKKAEQMNKMTLAELHEINIQKRLNIQQQNKVYIQRQSVIEFSLTQKMTQPQQQEQSKLQLFYHNNSVQHQSQQSLFLTEQQNVTQSKDMSVSKLKHFRSESLGSLHDKTVQKHKMIQQTDKNNSQILQQYSSSVVLPKLRQSIQQAKKQEFNLVNQQTIQIKSELNNLRYQNLQMKSKLNSLQIMENIEIGQDQVLNYRAQKNLDKLQAELKLQNEQILFDMQTQSYINVIITTCKQNGFLIKDYTLGLNFLIQNIDKMIYMEKEKLKQFKQDIIEIKQMTKEYKNQTNIHLSHQDQIVSIIRQSIQGKNDNDELFLNGSQFQPKQRYEQSQNSMNQTNHSAYSLKNSDEDNKQKLQKMLQFYQNRMQQFTENNKLKSSMSECISVFNVQKETSNILKAKIEENRLIIIKKQEELQNSQLKKKMDDIMEINDKMKAVYQILKQEQLDPDIFNKNIKLVEDYSYIKEMHQKLISQSVPLLKTNKKLNNSWIQAIEFLNQISKKNGNNYVFSNISKQNYLSNSQKILDRLQYIKENSSQQDYEQILEGKYDLENAYQYRQPLNGKLMLAQLDKVF